MVVGGWVIVTFSVQAVIDSQAGVGVAWGFFIGAGVSITEVGGVGGGVSHHGARGVYRIRRGCGWLCVALRYSGGKIVRWGCWWPFGSFWFLGWELC